jgi:hypothetical protein
MFHDIHEPDLIREKKIIVHDDPLVDMIDENQPFDPRYFRPLMVTLRVALHNVTFHLLHVISGIYFNEKTKWSFCFCSIAIKKHVRLDFVNDFVWK